jgi:multidrug efflux pump subunit AcrA (membrane-fusion protein)
VDAYNRAILLAEPGGLEVRADMQAADARQLAQGMPAVVEITNRPGEKVSGQVRRVPYGGGGGSETDGSVRVALEEGQFGLGDVVLVTVVLEHKGDVLWLPPEAIRSFEGRDFVVVQEGEVQRRVDVKLGLEGEDQVEIEEGLSQGPIVVGQ